MANGNIEELANLTTIRSIAHNNEFVKSLLNQFDRNGRLSEKQWKAVNRMADEIRNPKPKVVLDFAAIIAIFTTAAASLKFPKVRLALADGSEVVLSRAGDRAAKPGTINVTNGVGYGEPDNQWYGRIEKDGNFQQSRRNSTDELVALLTAFSADPIGVAKAYGKLTGNCCFCGRKLTDDRSTTAGYGQTCSKNWALPWGVGVKRNKRTAPVPVPTWHDYRPGCECNACKTTRRNRILASQPPTSFVICNNPVDRN